MREPRRSVELSLVIPAYQEAERLPRSLSVALSYLREHGPDFEVIVVDDGSTDGTSEVCRNHRSEVRCISLDRNSGKGAAVRTGVLASCGQRVLISDADFSSPITELPKLEAALDSASLAFGSRALARDLIAVRQPWYRESMGRVFNILLQALGVRGIRDTQCGFKLLDGNTARSLFAEMTIDGFAFDVELFLRARRRGLEVLEVPVVWRHIEDSRVHPVRHSLQMLRDVLWLRLRGLDRR